MMIRSDAFSTITCPTPMPENHLINQRNASRPHAPPSELSQRALNITACPAPHTSKTQHSHPADPLSFLIAISLCAVSCACACQVRGRVWGRHHALAGILTGAGHRAALLRHERSCCSPSHLSHSHRAERLDEGPARDMSAEQKGGLWGESGWREERDAGRKRERRWRGRGGREGKEGGGKRERGEREGESGGAQGAGRRSVAGR
eukprot:81659-Rhodomonas_salina.1